MRSKHRLQVVRWKSGHEPSHSQQWRVASTQSASGVARGNHGCALCDTRHLATVTTWAAAFSLQRERERALSRLPGCSSAVKNPGARNALKYGASAAPAQSSVEIVGARRRKQQSRCIYKSAVDDRNHHERSSRTFSRYYEHQPLSER